MDTVLGLLGLAVYVAGVLVFSAAVTALVVKLSPVQGRAKRSE
jgi:hypothetical protein